MSPDVRVGVPTSSFYVLVGFAARRFAGWRARMHRTWALPLGWEPHVTRPRGAAAESERTDTESRGDTRRPPHTGFLLYTEYRIQNTFVLKYTRYQGTR